MLGLSLRLTEQSKQWSQTSNFWMFINQCIALHLLLRVSSGSTSECYDPIVEHLWHLSESHPIQPLILDLPPIRSLNDPTIIPLRQPPSPPCPVLTPCALLFNLTSSATNAAVPQLSRLASSRCTAVNRVIEQISACRLVFNVLSCNKTAAWPLISHFSLFHMPTWLSRSMPT